MDNMITKDTVLGEMKVAHAAKCRNTSGESIMCHFTVDYTGCTVGEVLFKAVSSDTIAGQRAWEKMTPDELREKVNGQTFHAKLIGRKVKSDVEIKAEYKARFDASSPKAKKQMIEELQELMNEVE